jgi:MoxR-like ATPase
MTSAIREILDAMQAAHYVADPSIATSIHLARSLGRPLLVEGPAGVGKTEIAKVLSRVLDTRLIRLQCYEGLDQQTALYEWNYPRQLLHIRLAEAAGRGTAETEADIFSEKFLLRRPLLAAITEERAAPVLLVDEIDRAELEFEAFLLEVLSDFQVTIPEVGTIRATHPPIVVLTSNRTRDLSDALRRRCLHLWIDYPSRDKEEAIIRLKVPEVSERLAGQIARAMVHLRTRGLAKAPGVAESLDWGAALVALGADRLDADTLTATVGCVLKDADDLKRFEESEMDAVLTIVESPLQP